MLSSTAVHNFRLLQPEVIDLEPEYVEQARIMSCVVQEEAHQWQIYLNTLAQIGFTQWVSHFLNLSGLSKRLADPAPELQPDAVPFSGVASLCQVGEFRFCLITMEHVLDETVSIPHTVVNASSGVPHFYVAIEMLEEQEQMILRGFLRHDQLTQYLAQIQRHSSDDLNYQLSLYAFDLELNHLLFDCRYLDLNKVISSSLSQPTALPPTSRVISSNEKPSTFQTFRTNLSQWLEGLFEQEWLGNDDLLNLGSNLAFSTRSIDVGVQRGKLIDLGVQLKDKTVALLVHITPELEDKLTVFVQLHPANGQQYLSPDLNLKLLSKAGKVLQEVKARNHDNYIQLKPFMGEPGKCFSLVISCDQTSHSEDFRL